MKSVTRLVLVSALLVVVGLGFGLSSAYAKTVKGTIVSMDGGMLVVRTTDGQEQHFTLGTGVTVPTDVRTGSMVEVTVGDTGDQTTVVSMIHPATVTTSTTTYNSTPSSSTPSTSTPSSSTTSTTTSTSTTENQYANTASPIWAYALVGLIGLAGALAFRRWRVAQA